MDGSREFSARYRLAILGNRRTAVAKPPARFSLARMPSRHSLSLGYNGARSERIFSKSERFAGLKNLLHADFVERQRRKGFLLLSLIFFLSTTYGDIALGRLQLEYP